MQYTATRVIGVFVISFLTIGLLLAGTAQAGEHRSYEGRPDMHPNPGARMVDRIEIRNSHREHSMLRVEAIMSQICGRLEDLSQRRGLAAFVLPAFCGDPEPEPIGHLLISEVYYDIDGTHGAEPSYEWIEIYNPTDSAVDISGWTIEDVASSDIVPGGATIAAGGYLVLTPTDSLGDFWTIPAGAVVVDMGSSLGNGLGNSGDALILRNVADELVDSVSWGAATPVFEPPSAPDVPAGHSLARSALDVDTDTAADWEDREVPTPGE